MINPDSDLARAHPEWILATGGRLPPLSRRQQVLDLGHPEAYDYILERLDALLTEYDIGYLKWDHNRDLVDAGHGPPGDARGARPDPRGLPAAGRAPPTAPEPGDRVLRSGWRPGRPRDPGAHRPGLGQRLHRRARTPADPALHPAAGPAGTDRRSRRRPEAHTTGRTHDLELPRRHRAVRSHGHRVGPQPGDGDGTCGADAGSSSTRIFARCCTPGGSCAPTTPTRHWSPRGGRARRTRSDLRPRRDGHLGRLAPRARSAARPRPRPRLPGRPVAPGRRDRREPACRPRGWTTGSHPARPGARRRSASRRPRSIPSTSILLRVTAQCQEGPYVHGPVPEEEPVSTRQTPDAPRSASKEPRRKTRPQNDLIASPGSSSRPAADRLRGLLPVARRSAGCYLSLTDYNLLRRPEVHRVRQLPQLAQGPDLFWNSLKVTVYYVVHQHRSSRRSSRSVSPCSCTG